MSRSFWMGMIEWRKDMRLTHRLSIIRVHAYLPSYRKSNTSISSHARFVKLGATRRLFDPPGRGLGHLLRPNSHCCALQGVAHFRVLGLTHFQSRWSNKSRPLHLLVEAKWPNGHRNKKSTSRGSESNGTLRSLHIKRPQALRATRRSPTFAWAYANGQAESRGAKTWPQDGDGFESCF